MAQQRMMSRRATATIACFLRTGLPRRVDFPTIGGRTEAPEILEKAMAKVRPKMLYADAGYNAEWVHAVCREHWNVESFIPPSVHRRYGSVGGHYRSKMVDLPKSYGRRWHVESFMSGLKRTTGNALNARLPKAMFAEATFRVIAYALRL